MRILVTVLAPLTLLAVGLAPGTAQAADCKLQRLDSTPMIPIPDGRYLLPVKVNGTMAAFLFDTGAARTQIGRTLAEQLKLDTRQGNIQLFDAAGNISRDVAAVKELTIAHMRSTDLELPISTHGGPGIVALDHLASLDVDMDFAGRRLNFFSPNHCNGQVVYWTSPASVAVVPTEVLSDFHIRIPVTLDGHTEQAIIDTGATTTYIEEDEEKRVFNLTLGDSDTPESGPLNGDESLMTYKHRFKTLSLGEVTVSNPDMLIIPNAMGRNADRAELVGNRTKTEKDLLRISDLTIGMDVLRKLHIYVAFKERKMYISAAGASVQPATSAPPQ